MTTDEMVECGSSTKPLKLFLVIRWGNDESPEGPNHSDDTCFLVRACERDEAAALADLALQRMSCDRVPPFCQSITEVGIDLTDERMPAIVIGPFVGRTCFSGHYPTGGWGREIQHFENSIGPKWRPSGWYAYEDL